MTEQLRTKHKPIAHLGISAEFKFLEIDMSNLVSYKTYENFEKQIRGKENLRKRRKDRENKYIQKAKLIDQKKHEYYLKNNTGVSVNTKSRYVPVWDEEKTITEDTWFTLDGKEIKNTQKSNQPWQEDEKEEKEEQKDPSAGEESNTENSEGDVWNEFEITPQGPSAEEEFPSLGGGPPPQIREKIPVIVTKARQKGKNKRNKKKTVVKQDNEFAVSNGDEFTLAQFMTTSDTRRKNNRRKGRR